MNPETHMSPMPFFFVGIFPHFLDTQTQYSKSESMFHQPWTKLEQKNRWMMFDEKNAIETGK